MFGEKAEAACGCFCFFTKHPEEFAACGSNKQILRCIVID
jgi:hypothetical protein